MGDAFGDDAQTRTFAERYFQVQHTDLLFADAAIFEGTAERMLVPLFIGRDFPKLAKKYVSFLDIGGSHEHRLRPLVERLGIPTVVITDQPRTKWAHRASGGTHRRSSRPRVRERHTELVASEAAGLLSLWETDARPVGVNFRLRRKVRFAWELPVSAASDQWPSSFEDALVLSNIDWFKALDQEKDPITGKKKDHRGTLGNAGLREGRSVAESVSPLRLNASRRG
ncbi:MULTISPECIES: TOPRIM nucleotidyl transferase/hydrolase domain-containing protein [unclassified Pseudomonas]|uniref:ATP-dependent endonuclease n=1 Tax=unclassified Pseudomonas TaxID=196821 RepID=UPI002E2FA9F7|nr:MULTISPECIES: TOPRIM nucleotidyl transferase/hydrolase domain-containing protein [unclassified Pseudomonas]